MNGFYKGFKEDKAQREREEKARQTYGVEENRPVIIDVRPNRAGRFFHYVADFIFTVMKVIIYIAALFLSSVGLTTLINAPLRELFIKIFLP